MVCVDSCGNIINGEPNLCKQPSLCFVCKSEVRDEWPALRFYEKKQVLCMGCEGAEIEVWRVSLPGEYGGYYDHNFSSMAEGLKHMDVDSSFEVRKELIKAAKYLSLPEFQGF